MSRKEKWFKAEEKGSLIEFGYSPKKSNGVRRSALNNAVESPKHSGLEVFRKLMGLANVTKNTQPKNSKIYRSDANWVKAKFEDTYRW